MVVVSGFQHDIAGGNGNLVITSVQSPNFSTGVSGWQISKSGSAEFNNLTVRGTFDGQNFIINGQGAFFYSGTPALGNLVASVAPAAGVDPFGNAFSAGMSVGAGTVPQVTVAQNANGATIAMPTNAADETGLQPATIYSQIINSGLVNQQLALLIASMSCNVVSADPNQWNILMAAGADDASVPSYMQILDNNAVPFLTFSNLNGVNPQMSIGQDISGSQTFISIPLTGALLTYSSTSGGTVTKTFTSSTTWTVPTGVTVGKVECWAASGGGQWASGAGGGGGEYAKEPTNTLVPGNVATITVGAGGTGGTLGHPTGTNGGNSVFSCTGSTTVTAHGGKGSTSASTAGGTGSTNTTHFNGGSSTASSTGANQGGAGGGGSAGSSGAGGAGGSNSGSHPGAGGGSNDSGSGGGGGGWGGSGSTSGAAGGAPGGGGGSGGASASSGANGGNGARGMVRVTYTQPGTTGIQWSLSSSAGTDGSGNSYPAGFQGTVTAVQPGSSPSTPEVWHAVSLGTNLTGTIRVKVLPFNAVMLDISVSDSSATAASITIGSLPSSSYYPTSARSFPLALNGSPSTLGTVNARVNVPTSGALTITTTTTTGAPVAYNCSVIYPLD